MNGITILSTSLAELVRSGKHLHARLLQPATVLSTSHVNGGLRLDLKHLVNHQSCEPVKHQERFELITGLGQEAYHEHICAELQIPPASTALMGTAAAMQYLGISTLCFEDLSVSAIVTAGVTGNAGCAGDSASYDERAGKWIKSDTNSGPAKSPGTHGGTINTLLLLSSPFSHSALTRAIATMTEGKSAALNELAVGSKYSSRLATGTGTDQFIIAAPSHGAFERTWTGKHTKAGELIGLSVLNATKEALRWQNGMEPSYTRSIFHALGRFGFSEEQLKLSMEKRLSPRLYQFFKDNWNPVCYEPQMAAAAYAFSAVIDRCAAGTIGPASASEALINQAALMACGLACRPDAFLTFRSSLEKQFRPSETLQNTDCVDLAFHAIELGWLNKWSS